MPTPLPPATRRSASSAAAPSTMSPASCASPARAPPFSPRATSTAMASPTSRSCSRTRARRSPRSTSFSSAGRAPRRKAGAPDLHPPEGAGAGRKSGTGRRPSARDLRTLSISAWNISIRWPGLEWVGLPRKLRPRRSKRCQKSHRRLGIVAGTIEEVDAETVRLRLRSRGSGAHCVRNCRGSRAPPPLNPAGLGAEACCARIHEQAARQAPDRRQDNKPGWWSP